MKRNKVINLISIGFLTFVIVFSALLGTFSLISHLNVKKETKADYITQDISSELKTGITNSEKEYTIGTAEDLYNFAYCYSTLKNEDGTTFDKKSVYYKVKLVNDIDMSDVKDSQGNKLEYYSISGFYGEFDGQGHTIKNLTSDEGIFYSVYGTTSKYSKVINLKLENINIITDYYGSAPKAILSRYIQYCLVENCDVLKSKVGNSTTPITGDVVSGLIGISYSTNNILNCNVECDIYSTSVYYLGGFVGEVYFVSETTNLLTIEECKSYGSIYVELSTKHNLDIGGFVGIVEVGTETKIKQCINTIEITTKNINEANVGGIAGKLNSTSTLIGCSNMAKISATNNTILSLGGIVGKVEDIDSSISESMNNGVIYGVGNSAYIGGITGYNYGTIEDCLNMNEVSGYGSEMTTNKTVNLTLESTHTWEDSYELDGRTSDAYNDFYKTDKRLDLHMCGLKKDLFDNRSTGSLVSKYKLNSYNDVLTDLNRGWKIFLSSFTSNTSYDLSNYNRAAYVSVKEPKCFYIAGICGFNEGDLSKCFNSGEIKQTANFSKISYFAGTTVYMFIDIYETDWSNHRYHFQEYGVFALSYMLDNTISRNVNIISGNNAQSIENYCDFDKSYTKKTDLTRNVYINKCYPGNHSKTFINTTTTTDVSTVLSGSGSVEDYFKTPIFDYDENDAERTDANGNKLYYNEVYTYMAYSFDDDRKINNLYMEFSSVDFENKLTSDKTKQNLTFGITDNERILFNNAFENRSEQKNEVTDSNFANGLNSNGSWYKGADGNYYLKTFSWIHSVV